MTPIQDGPYRDQNQPGIEGDQRSGAVYPCRYDVELARERLEVACNGRAEVGKRAGRSRGHGRRGVRCRCCSGGSV